MIDGLVSDDEVTLRCSGLPTSSIAMFLTSPRQGSFVHPAGSQGTLCLDRPVGRFDGPGQVRTADSGGSVSLDLDLERIPQLTGFAAAQPGETWNFTTWYRDLAGAAARPASRTRCR